MANPYDPFLGGPGMTLQATPVPYVGPTSKTPDTSAPDGNGGTVVTPGVNVVRGVLPFPSLFDSRFGAVPNVGGFL